MWFRSHLFPFSNKLYLNQIRAAGANKLIRLGESALIDLKLALLETDHKSNAFKTLQTKLILYIIYNLRLTTLDVKQEKT